MSSLYQKSDEAIVKRLAEVAEARGVPPAQIALAWVARRPGVTAPIVGATKPAHLVDAVAAMDVVLSKDEVGRLEELYRPRGVDFG